mmetsp:Transcript_26184/g.69739  ORF Transcript_26184/g.69739 Transcript_26184/m.69739 type:complete len:216 (+) Transcript_26184:128-775(+)
MAPRWWAPLILFASIDLPTLGRPRIATIGRFGRFHRRGTACPEPLSVFFFTDTEPPTVAAPEPSSSSFSRFAHHDAPSSTPASSSKAPSPPHAAPLDAASAASKPSPSSQIASRSIDVDTDTPPPRALLPSPKPTSTSASISRSLETHVTVLAVGERAWSRTGRTLNERTQTAPERHHKSALLAIAPLVQLPKCAKFKFFQSAMPRFGDCTLRLR